MSSPEHVQGPGSPGDPHREAVVAVFWLCFFSSRAFSLAVRWSRPPLGHVCRVKPQEQRRCKRCLLPRAHTASRCARHLFCCRVSEKAGAGKKKCRQLQEDALLQPALILQPLPFLLPRSQRFPRTPCAYNTPTFIFFTFFCSNALSQQSNCVTEDIACASFCFWLLCFTRSEGTDPLQVTVSSDLRRADARERRESDEFRGLCVGNGATGCWRLFSRSHRCAGWTQGKGRQS